MTEPHVFAKRATERNLSPGKTYRWCACGRSADQPWCDGSHEGTGIEPVAFTVKTKQSSSLCLCKHTMAPPFCDGAHYTIK